VRNQYAVDPDDVTSAARAKWWETLPIAEPEPYEAAAWKYIQTSVEVEEESDQPSQLGDQDDLDVEDEPWWETIGGEGPKPYEAAAWTYASTVVYEVEDACPDPILADGTPINLDLECTPDEWWASIGGEGPKPYATATWQYLYDSDFILEFVAVTTTELASFDEGVMGDADDRVDYDAGLFGSAAGILIDGIFYTATGVGIEVKRTFSEIKVYDSLASSPGALPLIEQPLGNLATEPNGGGDLVLLDPGTLGDTELGTDPLAIQIETDVPPLESQEILINGGGFDGFAIEFARTSHRSDDIPPGQLLGQLNYETFGSVITVTSWDHYNWEDDTPIRKAVEAMLNSIPAGIVEVRVLDDPTAFWQSLGFARAYKGDPYIHYFPG
jgi:hypothetical protein